jgi:hypothetical protein
MLLALDKHAQIFVIVKNKQGKACVNHFIVEPDPQVTWKVDKLDTAPVESYWALDLLRDCTPDAEGRLDPVHIDYAEFAALVLGAGNYVFDTTSQFIYPHVLTDELRDHFMTVIKGKHLPYYRHKK